MRLGIRRKLIGTLMLVGLLPLALSLAIILGGGATLHLQQVRQSYTRDASMLADRLSQILGREELEKLTLLSEEPVIVDYARAQNAAHVQRRANTSASKPAGTSPAIADPYARDIEARWHELKDADEPLATILHNPVVDRLKLLSKINSFNRQLFVTDSAGEVIAADVKSANYYQFPEDWWQAAWNGGEGRPYISSVTSNPVNGMPVIAIAVPIYDVLPGNGKRIVLGIIKQKIELQWLEAELKQLIADNGGADAIYDRGAGRAVFPLELSPEAIAAQDTYRKAQGPLNPGIFGAMRNELILAAAPVRFDEHLHSQVNDAIHPDWVILLAQPSQDALTNLYKLALMVAGTGVGLILIFFILGVAIANREIIIPIFRLREATAAVGRGELNVRLLSSEKLDPTFRGDELGQLAHDFDEMTRELQKNVGQLARSNEAKRRFMELAGHELRTPVTYILGVCQLAQKQFQQQGDKEESAGGVTVAKSNASLQSAFTKVSAKALRLSRIIDNLLKLVSNDQFTTKLIKQPIDVRAMILQVCNDVRPFVAERKQQILVDVAENLPSLEGDRDKLEDALTNLVSNAIRFSPDGATIKVSGHVVVGDMIEILVQDQGQGIPAADLANLFEPFYTGTDIMHHHSGTIEYGSKGLGLGLAIVRRFVEIHGGTVRAHSVTAKSEKGEDKIVGTQFQIMLPIPQKEPGADGAT